MLYLFQRDIQFICSKLNFVKLNAFSQCHLNELGPFLTYKIRNHIDIELIYIETFVFFLIVFISLIILDSPKPVTPVIGQRRIIVRNPDGTTKVIVQNVVQSAQVISIRLLVAKKTF